MKIRLDHVTNSSTASYVVLGFKIKDGEFDYEKALGNFGAGTAGGCEKGLLWDALYALDCAVLHGREDGLPSDDEHVVGKYVAYIGSEDWVESIESDLVDFIKPVTDLHQKLGATVPIKLYIGTKNA